MIQRRFQRGMIASFMLTSTSLCISMGGMSIPSIANAQVVGVAGCITSPGASFKHQGNVNGNFGDLSDRAIRCLTPGFPGGQSVSPQDGMHYGNFVTAGEVNSALSSIEQRLGGGSTNVNGRLDGIDAKNREQDGRLGAHDNRLDANDTQNREQNSRLDANDVKNREQDGRLNANDTKNREQDGRLDANDVKNTEQDGRLTAHDNRLDANDVKNTEQDGRLTAHDNRLDANDTKNREQDGRLTAHDNRLDANDVKNTEQDGRLTAHDNRLDANDVKNTEQDGRLTAHDNRLDANDTKNREQDGRLTGIEDGAVFYNRGASGAKSGGVTFNDGSGSAVRLGNVAVGVEATDAVNHSQLNQAVQIFGGGAAINEDGSIKAPSYSVSGIEHNTVGSAVAALDRNTVQYVLDGDGKVTNEIRLTGTGTGSVVINNVAAGTSSTSAANKGQLDRVARDSFAHTEYRFNNLSEATNTRFENVERDVHHNRQEARGGIASAMGMAALRYDERPGKLSIAGGMGHFKGETALVGGLGFTAESQNFRANSALSYAPSTDDFGFNVGMSWTLN